MRSFSDHSAIFSRRDAHRGHIPSTGNKGASHMPCFYVSFEKKSLLKCDSDVQHGMRCNMLQLYTQLNRLVQINNMNFRVMRGVQSKQCTKLKLDDYQKVSRSCLGWEIVNTTWEKHFCSKNQNYLWQISSFVSFRVTFLEFFYGVKIMPKPHKNTRRDWYV